MIVFPTRLKKKTPPKSVCQKEKKCQWKKSRECWVCAVSNLNTIILWVYSNIFLDGLLSPQLRDIIVPTFSLLNSALNAHGLANSAVSLVLTCRNARSTDKRKFIPELFLTCIPTSIPVWPVNKDTYMAWKGLFFF